MQALTDHQQKERSTVLGTLADPNIETTNYLPIISHFKNVRDTNPIAHDFDFDDLQQYSSFEYSYL